LRLEALEDRSMPSFLGPVNYPVGLGPQAVAAADFNGDGRLDLAVANSGDNTVSVRLGNGDGTFQAAQNFATGLGPRSLAVGDFNGDGKLDVVTANANDVDVSVLLGKGDGTFGAASNIYIGGPFPVALAAGDLNGDNRIDLVVTSYEVVNAGEGGGDQNWYMNVLLGNGDGTFAPVLTTDPGLLQAVSVALADVNADGRQDVVTIDGYNGAAIVLLGNGDGTFQPAAAYAGGANSIAVADFNGDGKPDLATGSVSILLGNGDGTFGTAQNFFAAGGSGGQSLAVADFNGDGKPDVATTASVLLGNGDGTLRPPIQFNAGYEDAVAAADFNGDGRPDLAVTNGTSNTVAVFINDGNWSAAPLASSFVVSGFPSPTTAGAASSCTVTAENASGTTATSYTGTVHFSSSDGQAGLPADYTFTAADAGVHTFSATLKTAGTQALTATDTTSASVTGSESGITVHAGAASMFLVAGFPASTTAGVAGSFTVTARDLYGNRVSGYTGAVHFSSSDVKAALPANYTFTAVDAGAHTFSATLKTAGTQSLTATDTTTASITGTDAGITMNPAAASQFIISAPATVNAGASFGLTLTIEDAYGNIVTNYTGTVHFSSTDTRSRLPSNYTFTAADKGVHQFTGLVLRTRGNQKITITDTLNSSLTGSVIENVL
jgi:hypothetical protein